MLKGVYILMILVSRNTNVKIGGSKELSLNNGFYAYVGSAQRYFRKRLRRHFRKVRKKCFWHIDYLLSMDCVSVVKAFYKEGEKQEECITAQSLSIMGLPVKGFGCSDCRCESHLFRLGDPNVLENECLKMGFKSIALPC